MLHMAFKQLLRHWSRDALLSYAGYRCDVGQSVREAVSRLGLHRRGHRAGRRRQQALMTAARESPTHGMTSRGHRGGEIPVINNHLRRAVNSADRLQMYHGYREPRAPAVLTVRRHGLHDLVRVGLFNARSVSNKSASIQQWITDTKLNVAALVETWHDDATSPDLIACAPPGFKFIEKARTRKNNCSLRTNHGGVCVLYDSSLHARLVQLPVFTTFEVVAVYAVRAGFNAVLVAIYRPGSLSVTQAFFDDFNDLLEQLATYSSPLIIVGDFNIHADVATDAHAGKLCDILSSHSLLQHVKSPTHRCGHTLDLLITRDNQPVEVLPLDPPMLSDHSFIVADVNYSSQPGTQEAGVRQVRNWRDMDVDAFADDLCHSELVVSPPDDVVDAFACYDRTLRTLLDKHAPLQQRRVRTRLSARWYDSECRVTKRRTRRLERNYRCRRTTEALAAWRQQFKKQRQLFQQKFTAFWSTTVDASRHNPRQLWRVVNDMLQPPRQQPTQKLTPADFAQFFTDKVSNIRKSTAAAPPPVITTRCVPPLSSFEPATVHEITVLLKNSPSKSCALDPIPTWLLKRLSTSITPVICNLCNLSMQSGTFPSQLKHARVLPLLKKPTMDPDKCSSYRPISNLSFISKLIERVVVRRFTAHVSDFDLFPVQQSAYRSFHSTETAVLSVHNDLVRSADNNQVSLLVLLDLSAAFDTVDHSILLSVLSNRFCVDGTALDWFRSYLHERTQSFVYDSQQTDSYPLNCSVPQGSVLGPVEFAAYTEDIADLTERHDVRSHLYADDTQLYDRCRLANVADTRRRLTGCVNEVARWCASRRLQLNADKTEVIWFGSKSNLAKLDTTDRSLIIGSETVQPSFVVRDLGVLLDAELSMKQHINKVSATCFYHLRRLRQVRRRIGPEITTQLVLALVTSRLDYCNSVLAALPRCTVEPLQRVQNAAARLIFNLGRREHTTPCLIQLHWLPVHYRIQYKLCILMHNIRHGRAPRYLSDIIQPTSARTTRSGLRSSAETTSCYVTPRLHTALGERAFSHSGPATWNSLPADLRSISDNADFKKQLKTFLFQKAFNVQ